MAEHYYSEKQTSETNEIEIPIYVFKKELKFFSASGLFSKEHIDVATKLLIEKCDLTNAKKVLDLGSGWGPVGVVLALRNPEIEFFASDLNERAVTYTKKNVRKHKVKVDVRKSDILKQFEEEKFDIILTNPPYAAGRKICYSFINESFEHLNKDGSLQLVARHQKGGKMLGKHMEEIFGNVETQAIRSGFRIYKSVKK